MNPIHVAAAFGLFKGLAAGRAGGSADPKGFDLTTHVVGPAVEEAAYRAAPTLAGVSPLASAALFAADHHPGKGATPAWTLWRLGETFAGGMLYHRAYAAHGFAGAFGAHALHNLAVTIGQALSGRPARPRRARRGARRRT